MSVQPSGDITFETPVSVLKLGRRIVNRLLSAGIPTVGVLIHCTATDLLKIRKFGTASLAQVRLALKKYGYNLAGEDNPWDKTDTTIESSRFEPKGESLVSFPIDIKHHQVILFAKAMDDILTKNDYKGGMCLLLLSPHLTQKSGGFPKRTIS